MKNSRLKNAKAITLIALIVTIIVLLILAGVSIAALTGNNGVLNNASIASTKNAYEGAEEKVKIAYTAVRTEIMAKTVVCLPSNVRLNLDANNDNLYNIRTN